MNFSAPLTSDIDASVDALLHAWDESKHPRQPSGSEQGGEFAPSDAHLPSGMGHVLFKGVPAQVIDSIEKNGLQRGGEWKDRPPSVYFTESEKDAHKYGNWFGNPQGHGDTKYGIVQVEMPIDVFMGQAKRDEWDITGTLKESWRIERDIPSSWIRAIKIYHRDKNGKVTLLEQKQITKHASTKTVYAVVFLDDNQQFQQYQFGPGLEPVDAMRAMTARIGSPTLMHHFASTKPLANRADFAAIKDALDNDPRAFELRMREILRKSRDAVVSWVQDRIKNLAPEQIQGLTVDTGHAMVKAVNELLNHFWRRGRDIGLGELPPHVQEDPTVKAAKTFVTNWDELRMYGDVQVDRSKFPKKYQFGPGFAPVDAMRAMTARSWLIKGVIEDAIKNAVRGVLMRALEGGQTQSDTIGQLRDVFQPYIGDPTRITPTGMRGPEWPAESTPENILAAFRLENIVRTESAWSLNQGRVSMADAAGDYIVGYEYSAILDNRTCFDAKTNVLLANGKQRAIESIKPGDFVISGTGKTKRVTACWRYPARRWRRLKFIDGRSVTATETHQFWAQTSDGFEWREAIHLDPNQVNLGARFTKRRIKSERVHSVWPNISPVQQSSAQVLLAAVSQNMEQNKFDKYTHMSAMQNRFLEAERRDKTQVLFDEMCWTSETGRTSSENLQGLQKAVYSNDDRTVQRPWPLLQSQMLSCEESERSHKDLPAMRQDLSYSSIKRRQVQRVLSPLFNYLQEKGSLTEYDSTKMQGLRQVDVLHTQTVPYKTARIFLQPQLSEKSTDGQVQDLREGIRDSQELTDDLLFGSLLQSCSATDEHRNTCSRSTQRDEFEFREAISDGQIHNRFLSSRLSHRTRDGRYLLAHEKKSDRPSQEYSCTAEGNRTDSFCCEDKGDENYGRFTAEDTNHATTPIPEYTVTLISNESIDRIDWAYDLEIEDDHSYIANGLIAHNTELCRFADGLKIPKEDAIRLTPPNHFQCRSTYIFLTQDDTPVEFSEPEKIATAEAMIPPNFK